MQDKEIQHAYKDLEKLTADKDAQRLYEIREKAERDWRSNLYAACQEGREAGRQAGLQEGQEGRAHLIQKMLLEGLEEALIKKIANLTQEELDIIKTQEKSF